MKTLVLFSILTVASLASPAAMELDIGVAHAQVNGLRRYAATRYLQTSKTDSVAVPVIRASMPIRERFNASLGYSYYGTLKGAGVAPSADIFAEGVLAAQVVTPFTSSEKVHELAIGASYYLHASPRLTVELGPDISVFHSRARIAYRSFSEEDVRIGARVQAQHSLTDRCSMSIGYRLVTPPSRTLNVFSLTVGYAL